MNITPERIEELTRVINNTSGYESWQGDYTPASLYMLGDWFASHVEQRKRTAEEMQGRKIACLFLLKYRTGI